MKALPWILIVLLALAVMFLWNRQQELSMLPHPDTTEYVETIPFYYPVPKDSVVIRYKYAKLPVKKDTCKVKQDTCTPDSAEVIIPIIQKMYKDSLYQAYDAKLDSIEVYSRTMEIKIPAPVPAKHKRWGIGLQAGYGYPNGWYIGVGVSHNLFMW